jgi:hypothetical protein
MLPILIIPEHLCEPAQLRHIDASYPGPLCFGPAGTLFQALADCAARLYRFWGRVVERMRAADANGNYPKG